MFAVLERGPFILDGVPCTALFVLSLSKDERKPWRQRPVIARYMHVTEMAGVDTNRIPAVKSVGCSAFFGGPSRENSQERLVRTAQRCPRLDLAEVAGLLLP